MSDGNDNSRSALGSKNFRIYMFGNSISVVGLWIQRLAIGWQAWQLSESPLMVGLVAGAQFLPMFLLTPLFGVIVDRISSRDGAVVMHIIMIVLAAILAALTLSNAITIEWLLGLALAQGIAYSAYSPMRLSLIPDLVPTALFPSAVAINSIGFAYAVNAVSYLPIIVALLIIKPITTAPGPPKEEKFIGQLLEGLRYTRDHPSIRQVILIAGVSTFFGRGVIEILPALVVLIFNGGSALLAGLMAAGGAGAIGASIIFSLSKTHKYLPAMVLIGAVGVGISMFLFANVSQISYQGR
jgi:MFS family permease